MPALVSEWGNVGRKKKDSDTVLQLKAQTQKSPHWRSLTAVNYQNLSKTPESHKAKEDWLRQISLMRNVFSCSKCDVTIGCKFLLSSEACYKLIQVWSQTQPQPLSCLFVHPDFCLSTKMWYTLPSGVGGNTHLETSPNLVHISKLLFFNHDTLKPCWWCQPYWNLAHQAISFALF